MENQKPKPDPTVVGLDPARIQVTAPQEARFRVQKLDPAQADKATRVARLLVATRALQTAAGEVVAGLSREAAIDAERILLDALEESAIEAGAALDGLGDPTGGSAGPQTLPEFIRAEREARGLSFEAWAEAVGVHSATIRRWEGGATVPGFEDLQALVEAGVDPTVLLGLPAKRP